MDTKTTASVTLAPGPEEVRPLLIGATVPEARVLDLAGNEIPLGEIAREKPTVFIFYRGGW